jgi:choline dehydrogenase-like flavoprotein
MYFPFVTAKSLGGLVPRTVGSCALREAADDSGARRDVRRRRSSPVDCGRPVVHYTLARDTIEALVNGTRAAAQIFFAAGAVRMNAPMANPPVIERRDAYRARVLINARHFLRGQVSVTAAHLMGGCAMGQPHSAVTDSYGRVHGVPWLRVADSSLFPDAVEVNPYLTVMALADRVAEGIRADAGMLLSRSR